MSGKQVLLFAHPSMKELADRIFQLCKSQANNSVITRKVEYLKDGIRWDRFADGFPNFFIENVKGIAGQDVVFLSSFHNSEVIFEQLSVIMALPRYLVNSFICILPYFPTGTMERVDKEGQIATAKSLAQLLSCIPLSGMGPPQIIIFDIHALQERFYFSDNVIPRLESAVNLLFDRLTNMETPYPFAIAFPDDGARKRFQGYFDNFPLIVCSKVREGDRRVIKISEGVAKAHHVVIVDDLVQTGGTLIECSKELRAAGAAEVSAYATHAVFPQNSWEKFTTVGFSNFWITDSLPHARHIAKHPPFCLLSLDSIIAKILIKQDG